MSQIIVGLCETELAAGGSDLAVSIETQNLSLSFISGRRQDGDAYIGLAAGKTDQCHRLFVFE